MDGFRWMDGWKGGWVGGGWMDLLVKTDSHHCINIYKISRLSTGCYSGLMKASPELMMSALVTHNNLIQKAKWTNFGHTVDQEGGGQPSN